ncbi:MAG: hypothetical protein FJ076_14445 [Cyanobacteria bacterium K_DeepCast_35m_m1_288]|nr:hypothetical protein [Cyanobacteria bacterium K_DeepCast_35m_m1_288]
MSILSPPAHVPLSAATSPAIAMQQRRVDSFTSRRIRLADLWPDNDDAEAAASQAFLAFLDRAMEEDPALVVPADQEQLMRLADLLKDVELDD